MATLPSPAEILWQEEHISDNKAPDIIAVNVICFFIACSAVAARFTARRIKKIAYGADDWLILAGLFVTLGVVITSLLGVRYGAGKHAILMEDPAAGAKVLLAAEVIWGCAISTVKVSILLLYHRIFALNNRAFTATLWIVGIFIIGYCTTQTFAALFQCIPIEANWTVGIRHHCVNSELGGTIISAVNVLTDFVLLVLPMPILYKLQKPWAQKAQIMGMFLLGGLVCFASIYRTIVTHEISNTDPTWSDVSTDEWSIIELCIGILSACLPTMRPLFSRAPLPSKLSLWSGSGWSREKGVSGGGRSSHKGFVLHQSPPSSVRGTPNVPRTPSQPKSFSDIGLLPLSGELKPEELV